MVINKISFVHFFFFGSPPLSLTSCRSHWVAALSPAGPGSFCMPPCLDTWKCGTSLWSRSVLGASAEGCCPARWVGDAASADSTRECGKFCCRRRPDGRAATRPVLQSKGTNKEGTYRRKSSVKLGIWSTLLSLAVLSLRPRHHHRYY